MEPRRIYSEAVEARLEELDVMLCQRQKEIVSKFINSEDMREAMTAVSNDYFCKQVVSEKIRLMEIAIPIKYELRLKDGIAKGEPQIIGCTISDIEVSNAPDKH